MDRLDVMRLFTRIVERRSFTVAAQDLELPRSTATQAIKQLESRLGVRLLQRTTRHVRPTLDGEAYYPWARPGRAPDPCPSHSQGLPFKVQLKGCPSPVVVKPNSLLAPALMTVLWLTGRNV